ncbi:MAG TPA: hypothetical protein VFQ61_14345 [Polyangiaceae bacterium]|nr:hypothetical protein [Polyangiaceae bacterium]
MSCFKHPSTLRGPVARRAALGALSVLAAVLPIEVRAQAFPSGAAAPSAPAPPQSNGIQPSSGGAATASRLGATLNCPPAQGAQRVVCALRVEAPAGYQISWVDALVLDTPAFAGVLRSRVWARNARSSVAVEVPLALVALSPGSGWMTVRARAVLCPREGTGRCRPFTREVRAEVVVEGTPRG